MGQDGIAWDRHTSSKRSFHETLKYCQKKFRHCQTNDFWQNRIGGCDYVRRSCNFPRFPYENFRQCKNRIGGCDYVRKSCKFQKVPPRTKIFDTVRQNNFEKNRDTQSLVYRCFRQNPFIFNIMKGRPTKLSALWNKIFKIYNRYIYRMG